jgi:hypothetical protein
LFWLRSVLRFPDALDLLRRIRDFNCRVCSWSNLMISDFGIAGSIYLLTGFPG